VGALWAVARANTAFLYFDCRPGFQKLEGKNRKSQKYFQERCALINPVRIVSRQAAGVFRLIPFLLMLTLTVSALAGFDLDDLKIPEFSTQPDTCLSHVAALGIPDSTIGYYRELLDCYAESGDDLAYARMMREARVMFPDDGGIMLREADFDYDLGLFPEAAALYDTLAVRFAGGMTLPDDSLAAEGLYQRRAESWSAGGYLDKADSAYAEALRARPDSGELAVAYFNHLETTHRHPRAALHYLAGYLREHPDCPEGWYVLGEAYVDRNRPFRARAAYGRVTDPESFYTLYAMMEKESLDDFLASNMQAGWEATRETRTYWTNSYRRSYLYFDRRVSDYLLLYATFTRDAVQQTPRKQAETMGESERKLQVFEASAVVIPPVHGCYLTLTGQRYLNHGVNSLFVARIEQGIDWGGLGFEFNESIQRQVVEEVHFTPRWEYRSQIGLNYADWTFRHTLSSYWAPDDIVLIGEPYPYAHELIVYHWEQRWNRGWANQAALVNHVLSEPALDLGIYCNYSDFRYVSQFYSSPEQIMDGGLSIALDGELGRGFSLSGGASTGMNRDDEVKWGWNAMLERSFRYLTLGMGVGYEKDFDSRSFRSELTIRDVKLW
jgi:tetratricopeptide (TPR) repeat protein